MATGTPTRRGREPEDRYELAYSDKLPAHEVLSLPASEPEVVDCGTEGGRVYFGDNLGGLLSLLRDPAVRGAVRCVYIDPPYSTTMRFLDRHERHAYEDTLAGAAYLEFLRRRLILLRELMADDGSIFVHLDQNMVFEVKLILDEVFGRGNFRNFITRKKCNTKNYTRNQFGNVADHILFYTKTERHVWHRPYDPWSQERILEEYPYVDEKTGRRHKRVPLHAPGTRRGATGKPWRDMLPPPGKHWQYPPAKLEELDKAGEIYWSPNGNPRRKVFFDPGKGVPVQDIWLEFKDAHNQNIIDFCLLKVTGKPSKTAKAGLSGLLAVALAMQGSIRSPGIRRRRTSICLSGSSPLRRIPATGLWTASAGPALPWRLPGCWEDASSASIAAVLRLRRRSNGLPWGVSPWEAS